MNEVQSNLTKALVQEATTEEKIKRAKKMVAKQVAFQTAFREGKLTVEQFGKLPKMYRSAYVARFGRPLSLGEQRAAATDKANKKRRTKAAKRSKVANRRRGK